MRTTTRFGLTVWNNPGDGFLPQDLEDNWDAIDARGRWVQSGTTAIAQGGYTSTAIGGQTILNKSATITFPVAFTSAPSVVASSSLLGTYVTVVSTSTTTATVTVNTLRNDSASFGTVNVDWIAVQE